MVEISEYGSSRGAGREPGPYRNPLSSSASLQSITCGASAPPAGATGARFRESGGIFFDQAIRLDTKWGIRLATQPPPNQATANPLPMAARRWPRTLRSGSRQRDAIFGAEDNGGGIERAVFVATKRCPENRYVRGEDSPRRIEFRGITWVVTD
jgi:hypothetical protein